jgi:hypothetical protein
MTTATATATTVQDTQPRRLDPSAARPWPLAIGVLGMPATIGVPDARVARVDLALHAYKLGYFLLDTLQVTSAPDAATRRWLEALARQVEADAFICAGPVDQGWVTELADLLRIVVRTVEP